MDGPPPPEEDFSAIPLNERITHKNWKARVHGYEALQKLFSTTTSEDDPAFRPYLNNSDLLKKIALDTNAVAQEKGVECLLFLVRFAGENAAKTREAVLPALVDKCYGSTRSGTKQKALELTLDYVEVENSGEGVVRDILPGLAAKQPKVVAGSVTALKDIVRAYGPKVVPPGPILKSLPKIFGHSDKTVRAEGTLLVQSLYTYMGPAIQSFLSELKPVQVKELNEGFEVLDKDGKGQGTGKQERWTKVQAREREAAEMLGSGAGEAVEEEAPPDPRAFLEEVDIVPKIPPDFQALVASSKWKERKETLEAVLEIVKNTPKIKDSNDIAPIVGALAKRMADANVMCVIAACNVIEGLAKGIGEGFGKYRQTIVPPMLERFKERKQNVVDAIGAGLDEVFATSSLPDLTEDILNSLKVKNPQVKEGTLKFLVRCLSNTRIPPAKADVKPMSETLAALLEDSFEPIRIAAAEGLGTLMKIVGERQLNPVVDPLDDLRKAKVKEAFEKAIVKCKSGAAPPKPPPPKPAAAPPPKRAPPPKQDDDELLDDIKPPTKTPGKVPARFLAKKAPAAPAESAAPAAPAFAPPAPKKLPAVAPPPTAKAGGVKGSAPPAAASEVVKYKYTPEDAEAIAADFVPANMAAELGDGNWKVRLASLEEFGTWLEGQVDKCECEVLFRFLGKKPGWNEKNFQVSAKQFGILKMLAEQSPTFSKSCVAHAASHLTEKLGDMKLKKPAGEALITFAERTSLSFVLSQAYDPISKQKAPKMLADSIVWVNQALTEFGIAGLQLRPLIEFLKTALKNSNAGVRSSATNTLVTVRLFAGAGIRDLLEDLNAQLLTTIQGEFDKVDGQAPPVPTRVSADIAAAPAAGGSKGKGGGGGGDPLDELFPRVDLDKLVGATTILADAKSDAWKTRKEALELLQATLDIGTNKRLKPNMGDIGQVLKARLADTNKVVQGLALDIVSRIATGMNKPFEKYCRILVTPVAAVLADQKPHIRAAATATLTAIATACEGLDPMVHPITSSLESTNPVFRSSLFAWIADWFKAHEPSSLDLAEWAPPVVASLDDRNADVRKGAQAILPFVIRFSSFDHVMRETNSMKAASRQSVTPMIQAAKALAGVGSAPAAPAAPANQPAASGSARASIAPLPAIASLESAAPGPKRQVGTGARARKVESLSLRPESRTSVIESPPPSARFGVKGKIAGPSKRTVSAATRSAEPVTPTSSSFPFSGGSNGAKAARLARDGTRWIIEGGPTRKDLMDTLQHQMDPYVSRDLLALLFRSDHNAVTDHVTGLGIICDCYDQAAAGEESFGVPIDDMRTILVNNADLVFKYVSTQVHEPQPNLISKCMDALDSILALLGGMSYQLTEGEALCFVPTVILKLGDARETIRNRVSNIIQTLPRVYAYSRLFQLLLDHGLKSKVAKTRQGTLDELATILRKSGMNACDPNKAFRLMAALISDKDAAVRKSALSAIGEGYTLEGDRVWNYVGQLSLKDKTQLEERLRRVNGPAKSESPVRSDKTDSPVPSQVTRLTSQYGRPGSPSRLGGLPRSGSPAVVSRLGPSASNTRLSRAPSPVPPTPRSASPALSSLQHGGNTVPPSPTRRTLLPSRMAPPRLRPNALQSSEPAAPPPERPRNASNGLSHLSRPSNGHVNAAPPSELAYEQQPSSDGISITISSILSSDPARSVNALKKIQKILEVSSSGGGIPSPFSDLADHTEGLMETITLQMAHVFERHEAITEPANFRLAKHLIQTLNAFCDHAILAESLTVDILTSLLEELTMRLLQTDESRDVKIKDLSRFINMIILRLFATCRRISVFRALFNLLLQIMKPFTNGDTSPESREAKTAELVLKCIWKLARSIPADLEKHALDPVELFPAIEGFLQSIPPNEWRARATNKIPGGDMPLRTIKVIIQHVVAQYTDEVYEQLSSAFDDPSATIVYPYVYRILNSNSKAATESVRSGPSSAYEHHVRSGTPDSSQPRSPRPTSLSSTYVDSRHRSDSQTSRTASVADDAHQAIYGVEPDPDARLIEIIGHISSETTGALHKEGITELYQFLKAHPGKQVKVDKLLESTGPAFRKYIARALASRAADDDERQAAVADSLSRLESARRGSIPASPPPYKASSPRRVSGPLAGEDPALSRLHDIFQYQGRASVVSSSSSATSSHRPDSGTLMAQLAAMNGGGS
ncbi:hypothetical protein BOTBODRAFT_153038 [Botryobasidium botryosum FD-172 SS1]|uniref:TOG domain-containing protein n=1 Tax=Botryobasidium botryosum (strain FD-172 SS1) TaxID=930990 RepID=A0A067MXP4_BOTB1|nr:hypothetical protein BOTBODRAFT_153038 [Botryobasidium botryosum FD-172 SS1]